MLTIWISLAVGLALAVPVALWLESDCDRGDMPTTVGRGRHHREVRR